MAILLTFGLLMFGSSGAEPFILGSVMCLMVPVISWSAYKAISGHNVPAAAFLRRAVLAGKAAVKAAAA